MHVLVYGWEFPPNINGGLGVACYGIVKALLKRRVKISLVLPCHTQDTIHDKNLSFLDCQSIQASVDASLLTYWRKNLNIKSIDTLLTPYLTEEVYRERFAQLSHLYAINSPGIVINAQFTGKYGPNLVAEVLRYGIVAGLLAAHTSHDVIHAHDWMSILAGIEAKKHSGKPLIFHVHALEIDRSGESLVNHTIFNIEKYGMEEADRIIAVSQYTKNIIMKHYKIPDSKIVVIHNGIDPSPYKKPKSTTHHPKMVLFVGRITHQKGPRFFVAIAKKILEHCPDVQFVIAGQGNLLAETIHQVAGLRIGVNVHFTGFLKPEDINKLYQMASVYVMPSVSEPFGLSALEALSQHVPIVVSKQSGAAEVLPNVFKADFWDTDKIASEVLALLNYPSLKRTMLTHSLHDVKKLTWDNSASQFINLYQQLSR